MKNVALSLPRKPVLYQDTSDRPDTITIRVPMRVSHSRVVNKRKMISIPQQRTILEATLPVVGKKTLEK